MPKGASEREELPEGGTGRPTVPQKLTSVHAALAVTRRAFPDFRQRHQDCGQASEDNVGPYSPVSKDSQKAV